LNLPCLFAEPGYPPQQQQGYPPQQQQGYPPQQQQGYPPQQPGENTFGWQEASSFNGSSFIVPHFHCIIVFYYFMLIILLFDFPTTYRLRRAAARLSSATARLCAGACVRVTQF
jgi:hypothetical protein